jgi:SEC-C motif-containing protein
MPACPCGSGLDLNDCCAPLHFGRPAPTAEALMRSRYAAFATGNMDYLEKTCSPELRKNFKRPRVGEEVPEWTGVKILRTVDGGADDETGQVEFIANYKLRGQNHSMRELSDFRRIDGAWIYIGGAHDPKLAAAEKTGRNDPCPCGSGKKYKKCCA